MEAVIAQISLRCQEMVEQDDRFGDGKKFVKFEIDAAKSGVDQFASAAIFGNIEFQNEKTISNGNGTTTTSVPVVIKIEPPIPKLREFFNSHLQFSNEILFYSQLLPFLNTFLVEENSQFVKFLKGGTSDPVLLSYVIMENASKDGYQLSKSKQLLSLDHFLLTVNKLGRFHALSYIAKHQNRSKFDSLKDLIKETSWTDTRLETGQGDSDLVQCVKRATRKYEGTETNHNVDDKTDKKYQNKVNKLKEMVFDCPTRLMRTLTSPKEPMAVICHGDFCRNNVLFKYSEQTKEVTETSSPIDVLFFDMATIRYSSPVIDLSFFIYLNSNPEIRLHWDEILQSYHDGLKIIVETFADKNKINVIEGKTNYTSSSAGIFLPSLEDVHKEFVTHAIYGFMLCSFFLPVMMVDNPSEKFNAEMEGGEFWNVPEEVRHKVQTTMAGEEGTKALNHLVEHMIDLGFV